MTMFMKEAYKEAIKAYKKNEIPVGAVIVKNNKIISKAFNDRQKKYKVTGHAEINCILKAEKKINDWRLNGCVMYVTLEPCDMCQNIIQESRIDKVYYLLTRKENKKNENNKIIQICDCQELLDDYKKIINKFFCNLRD